MQRHTSTIILLHIEAWPDYTHLIALIYWQELSLVHYFIIYSFSLQ